MLVQTFTLALNHEHADQEFFGSFHFSSAKCKVEHIVRWCANLDTRVIHYHLFIADFAWFSFRIYNIIENSYFQCQIAILTEFITDHRC